MIVITGAAGFIGSCLGARLNESKEGPLVLVDDFTRGDKQKNLERLAGHPRVHRDEFFDWLHIHHKEIRFVFHLGARTDTTEMDEALLNRLNQQFSLGMWQACTELGIPLVYASSAATYGDGQQGFDDDPMKIEGLQPLNPYGWSKHRVDLYTTKSTTTPPRWAGLKFFNVYGPNEYHKARMASVVFHAHRQIKSDGYLRLFRSYRPEIPDGQQMRDFIYVEDVLDVCLWMLRHPFPAGIYNLGSGNPASFNELAEAIFRAMNRPIRIEYIDMPAGLAERYQYYTSAPMQPLRRAGYTREFTPVRDGVEQYVKTYLNVGGYR